MRIFYSFITIHKYAFPSKAKRLKDVLELFKHLLSVSFAIWHRIYKHNKILIANRTTNFIKFPLDLLLSHIILHKSNLNLLCWFTMDFWFLLFVSMLLRKGLCFARTTKTQEVMTSMEEKKGNSWFKNYWWLYIAWWLFIYTDI